MLTNPQKSLLKRAQREAAISDGEYRDALGMICGVNSSTDPRMTDRQLDLLLAYFEAICWRAREAGELPPPDRNSVFARRGYWADKNPAGQTSRDRFAARAIGEQVAGLEEQIVALGFSPNYLATIWNRTGTPAHYAAALRRTLRSRHAKPAAT